MSGPRELPIITMEGSNEVSDHDKKRSSDSLKNGPVVPVVSQHMSWISLDPIQGCPAACSYCFLWPLGITQKKPVQMIDPEGLYDKLMDFDYFNKSSFEKSPLGWRPPVAVGNHTDMCLTPSNRNYLLRMLEIHRERVPDVPLCILTKAQLDDSFLDQVAKSGVSVVFFISLAFLGRDVEVGAPEWQKRVGNFTRLRERNIPAVHWWRPITRLSTPDIETAVSQLNQVVSAGASCSVGIELAFGDTLMKRFAESDHTMNAAVAGKDASEQAEITDNLQEYMKGVLAAIDDEARRLDYPIFRSTSCAISWALARECYGARYRPLNEGKGCYGCAGTEAQQKRCTAFREANKKPSIDLLKLVKERLDLDSNQIYFDKSKEIIRVDATIRQDAQAHLTQVTSFPVVANEVQPTLAWRGDAPSTKTRH